MARKSNLFRLFICSIVLSFISCESGIVSDLVSDAVDTSKDLFVEPIADMAENAREVIKEGVEKSIETVKDFQEKLLDPYHEVMEMFKIKTDEEFTEDILDSFLDKFTERLHCFNGARKRSISCTTSMVSIIRYTNSYQNICNS